MLPEGIKYDLRRLHPAPPVTAIRLVYRFFQHILNDLIRLYLTRRIFSNAAARSLVAIAFILLGYFPQESLGFLLDNLFGIQD